MERATGKGENVNHRRLLTGLCLISLLAGAGAFTPAGQPFAGALTPEQVVDLRMVNSVVMAPDGGTVMYTLSVPRRESEDPGRRHDEIHAVTVDGGISRRLTHSPGRATQPAVSPDGTILAFLAKRGDDEHTQIYLLPLAGGEARRLTAAGSDVLSLSWAPDGSSLAFLAVDPESEERKDAEEAGRDWKVYGQDERPRRLWRADVTSGEASQVTTDTSSVWAVDWFPDGKRLAVTVSDRPDTDSSHIYKRLAIAVAGGGSPRTLWDGPGKMGAPRVSPDGRYVAVHAAVSANDPAAGSLFVIDASSGRAVNRTGDSLLTVTWVDWAGPEEILFTAHEGTASVLAATAPFEGGARRLAVGPPVFSRASLSADGRTVAFAASTSRHPDEVFVLARGDGRLRRLTDSNPGLAGADLGKQEVYRWTTSDGWTVEGILISPVGAATPQGPKPPYPLVNVVHGGPESCWRDGWNTSYSRWGQVLAGRGYAVLMANYRGSTGRGVAFAKADHRDLAGREFRDILEGMDALVSEGTVDPARVGIGGGSYGGYFSAWAATRHSQRFAAAVVFAGITNWISFTGTTDIPEENMVVHWDLNPYERTWLAWDRSPLAHLATAGTPVLIAHGQKDRRVPPGQAVELYTALRLRGMPVEMVTYPREPHGLRERAHQLDYMNRSLDWFDRWVKGSKRD
jgi:dipeptidyl aminopeptidase/acylaminoacyl peptidase